MSFLSPGDWGSIRNWLAGTEAKTIGGVVTFTTLPTAIAPSTGTYLTATSESGLSAEVNLGALTTGLLKHTVSGGISTPATAAAGTDYVSPSSTETLTNKTITTPIISSSAAQTTQGMIWVDSTNKSVNAYVNGITGRIPRILHTSSAAQGPSNTSTETSLVGTTITLPAAYLNVVGKTVRAKLRGHYSSKAATPGTLTIKVKLGSTVIAQTAAQTMASSVAVFAWELDVPITCWSTGASGTVLANGTFHHVESSVTYGDVGWAIGTGGAGGYIANSAGVTVDLTATQVIDVTATFGTQDVANILKSTNCTIYEE